MTAFQLCRREPGGGSASQIIGFLFSLFRIFSLVFFCFLLQNNAQWSFPVCPHSQRNNNNKQVTWKHFHTKTPATGEASVTWERLYGWHGGMPLGLGGGGGGNRTTSRANIQNMHRTKSGVGVRNISGRVQFASFAQREALRLEPCCSGLNTITDSTALFSV